jgi:hypothetical protein
VSSGELKKRLSQWTPPEPKYSRVRFLQVLEDGDLCFDRRDYEVEILRRSVSAVD